MEEEVAIEVEYMEDSDDEEDEEIDFANQCLVILLKARTKKKKVRCLQVNQVKKAQLIDGERMCRLTDVCSI